MKLFCSRVLLVLLAVLLVFPLAGCQPNAHKDPPEKIPIEEDPAYSSETLIWAEQTIFSLVLHTYREVVLATFSEKVEARLQNYAHRICQITAAEPIPEERYRSVIALLEKEIKTWEEWKKSEKEDENPSEKDGLLKELIALCKGEATTFEKLRAFYLELTYAFGAEHVASMVYDGCLLIYDARYEKTLDRFKETQYPFYQQEADAIAAEKAIFTNGVQKEAFVTLFKCSTAMAELLSANLDEISGNFSDAEILDMIRRLDPSKIDISQEGWELLLSKALRWNAPPYFATLVDAFRASGDLSRVSAVMNDAVKLWTSVLKNLVPGDITALRTGETEKLLNSICSRFDDDDWALFTSVTSVALANEQYSALAEKTYGEAYLEYLASIEQVDIEQLRASVGRTDFYQNLLNYLAGICPAISYEVNA